jgi:hypothetical protein
MIGDLTRNSHDFAFEGMSIPVEVNGWFLNKWIRGWAGRGGAHFTVTYTHLHDGNLALTFQTPEELTGWIERRLV